MASDHSVTTWIGLRGGNTDAASTCAALLRPARRVRPRQAPGTPAGRRRGRRRDFRVPQLLRAADRFPKLNDRQDLWQVLVMPTARKAFQERRQQQAQSAAGPAARTGPGRAAAPAPSNSTRSSGPNRPGLRGPRGRAIPRPPLRPPGRRFAADRKAQAGRAFECRDRDPAPVQRADGRAETGPDPRILGRTRGPMTGGRGIRTVFSGCASRAVRGSRPPGNVP